MEKLLNNADLVPVFMVIGVIVLAQFGTIVTIMVWGAKGIWWMAQHDIKTERNTKDINEAFRKIRGDNNNGGKNEGTN